MTPKEIQSAVFLAIQEAHQIIGGYAAHRSVSNIMNRKGKVLDKLAVKYGISPKHLNNVYFGKI
jgi:hypothetical protein